MEKEFTLPELGENIESGDVVNILVSFTITNLGGIGGTHFSPIVNHPEVAILGVARSRIEPVFIDGQFQPRTMLPLRRCGWGADACPQSIP